jgi:hypothetical protein
MANAALGLLPAEFNEHPHHAARRFLRRAGPLGAITHQEFVAYLAGYVDRHRLPCGPEWRFSSRLERTEPTESRPIASRFSFARS